MKKQAIFIAVLLALGAAFYIFHQSQSGGSLMPPGSLEIQDPILTLGETKIMNSIAITPRVINEDSRCKEGVQCFWAGRVVVETELKSGSISKIENMELGKGVSFAEKIVTLESATPPSPSYGASIDKNSYTFEYSVQTQSTSSPAQSTEGCFVGGCSSQICSDEPGAISTCEYTEAYGCYQTAKCERQPGGKCGWTPTAALKMCLDKAK